MQLLEQVKREGVHVALGFRQGEEKGEFAFPPQTHHPREREARSPFSFFSRQSCIYMGDTCSGFAMFPPVLEVSMGWRGRVHGEGVGEGPGVQRAHLLIQGVGGDCGTTWLMLSGRGVGLSCESGLVEERTSERSPGPPLFL